MGRDLVAEKIRVSLLLGRLLFVPDHDLNGSGSGHSGQPTEDEEWHERFHGEIKTGVGYFVKCWFATSPSKAAQRRIKREGAFAGFGVPALSASAGKGL